MTEPPPSDSGGGGDPAYKSTIGPMPPTTSPVVTTAMIPRPAMGAIATAATVFPAPVANLVTALASSAKLSLRVAAFFIEAILETSQYSTRMSLGYTRRLLVTAISSARRVYLMSNAALDGDLMGMMGLRDDDILAKCRGGPGATSTDAFLQVLDKYTNLGIYVVHHAFTMAELFAMSGFYLTTNAVQSAHFAAQESVALFDSLFGSNESSRALASIIDLVRRELLEDDRFKSADKGKITLLTALTKALTAFACLQNATWERTAASLKMKVMHDCTVLTEKNEASSQQVYDNLAPEGRRLRTERVDQAPRQPASPAGAPSDLVPTSIDLGPSSPTEEHSHSPFQSTRDLDYLFELEDLVGESGDEMYDAPPDDATRRSRRVKRVHEDMLEITEELSESTVVTRTFQRVGTRASPASWDLHTRQRSAPLPDVMVEPIDESGPSSGAALGSGSIVRPSDRLARRRSLSAVSEDENDWIEVDQILADDDGGDFDGDIIPTAPNGLATASSSYREALEHPYGNSDRIQFVLRTMTNRLLQRKRVVRRVSSEAHSQGPSRDSSAAPSRRGDETPRRADVRRIDWQESPGLSLPAGQMSINDRSSSPPDVSASASSSRRHLSSPAETPVPSPRKGLARIKFPFRSTRETAPMLAEDEAALPPSLTQTTAGGSRSAAQRQQQPQKGQHQSQAHQTHHSAHVGNGHSHNHRRTTPLTTTVQTSSNRVQAASSHVVPDQGDSSPANLYPHDELVRNIHRFMRYSSAAYGQNFLRILGLGNSDFNFPSTGKHHANSWAFAQHTNIPVDNIILTSSSGSAMALDSERAPPLVHYITVEHKYKAIVLTCRGTLGLSDVLVDLTCDYREISVEGGDPQSTYLVHGGMYQSALQLTAKKSTVHRTLVDALNRHPTYGLVLCGHSLGGGVAALLSIISSIPAPEFLKQNATLPHPHAHPPITTPFVTSAASGLPPGRPIHCYAYGPPAVTSIDLAKYASGLITSVVQNSDIVPCLSLGVLRDLKNVAVTLFEEGTVAEEIVGRVVGVYKRKFAFQQRGSSQPPSNGDDEPTDEQLLSDWMMSLIKTMRADMDNDKLYPPGMVYILEYFDVFVFDSDGAGSSSAKAQSKHAQRVILRQCDSVEERFREPLFTKTMLNDHLPSHYERSTQLLYEGLGHAHSRL